MWYSSAEQALDSTAPSGAHKRRQRERRQRDTLNKGMPHRVITLLGTAAALTATMNPPVTLNAASQRNAELVRQAATKQANDKGLLWLEHVNIVVGDRQEAERFYFEEGLGCFRDPAKPGGADSAWEMRFKLDVVAATASLRRRAASTPSS